MAALVQIAIDVSVADSHVATSPIQDQSLYISAPCAEVIIVALMPPASSSPTSPWRVRLQHCSSSSVFNHFFSTLQILLDDMRRETTSCASTCSDLLKELQVKTAADTDAHPVRGMLHFDICSDSSDVLRFLHWLNMYIAHRVGTGCTSCVPNLPLGIVLLTPSTLAGSIETFEEFASVLNALPIFHLCTDVIQR